jgi:hypothetical protein
MARRENKLVITYSAMDKMYQNGRLVYVVGDETAGPDGLIIVAPRPERDVDTGNDCLVLRD